VLLDGVGRGGGRGLPVVHLEDLGRGGREEGREGGREGGRVRYA